MKKYILILSSILSIPIFAATEDAHLSESLKEHLRYGRTLLHAALQRDCSLSELQKIIDADSSLVNKPSEKQEYPLEFAIFFNHRNPTMRMQQIMFLLLNNADSELIKNKRDENPSVTGAKIHFFDTKRNPEKPFFDKLCQFIKSETPNLQDQNIVEAVKTIASKCNYQIAPKTIKEFTIQHAYEIYDQYLIRTRPHNAV